MRVRCFGESTPPSSKTGRYPPPPPPPFTLSHRPPPGNSIDSTQRREAITDADWRKSSLNVYIRGFPAPRGTYNVRVRTTARGGEVSGGGSGGRGGPGREEGRQEEVEDLWVLSYVLAPPDVRLRLALEDETGLMGVCCLLIQVVYIVVSVSSPRFCPRFRGKEAVRCQPVSEAL